MRKNLYEYCIENNKQHLLNEWDYIKNNILNLTPNIITYGSNKKVNWKCSFGHEWIATINSRSRGNNCPYCSNKKH